MASVLDLGLLQYFNVIFSGGLVFVIVFALLQKTKILGGRLSMDAIVAIALAFLTAISSSAIALINFISPWFIVFFLFIILLIFAFRTMGVSEEKIIDTITKDQTVGWTVVGIGLVIILSGMMMSFGQEYLEMGMDAADGSLEEGELSEFETNVISTIINPKIMAAMIIFGVSIAAIALLTGAP